MKLDRAGFPFILAALLPAALLSAAGRPRLSAPFWALGAGFAFFFRDPERTVPAVAGAVLAPADGRIVVAGPAADRAAPAGAWTQISIFLSPIDVHVNRIPVSGRVVEVDYRPGRFHPAYRAEASSENERNDVWLETEAAERVLCRQITGVLVRRVVCRVGAGQRVAAGDRFGVMKFGSRIDLFLPARVVPKVAVGDRVRAGESVVAML